LKRDRSRQAGRSIRQFDICRMTPASIGSPTRDEFGGAWAARPAALISEGGRTALLLDDRGGEPLGQGAIDWWDASCALC